VDITRHDRRRRLTLVLLIITSLALVSLDERGSGVINSARTAAQDVVSPLQDLADDVINPAADWIDGLGRANELQDQNDKLRRQLDAARAQIAAGKANAARLRNLESILDLPDVADGSGVTAEVVGQSAGNFSRALRISKGSSSGIALDQPVVFGTRDDNATALVGRISRVSATSAIVERIDDANFGVGAQIMQGAAAGPPGTAEGQRDSSLLRFSVIDNSPASVELKKGDVAITIGGDDDKRYPRGLVIGTIVRTVGAGGSVRRDAELRPVVDLDALTVVKVLPYQYQPAPPP
jgi:rod shape-determining protein MreC